jgi:hypothetical protein
MPLFPAPNSALLGPRLQSGERWCTAVETAWRELAVLAWAVPLRLRREGECLALGVQLELTARHGRTHFGRLWNFTGAQVWIACTARLSRAARSLEVGAGPTAHRAFPSDLLPLHTVLASLARTGGEPAALFAAGPWTHVARFAARAAGTFVVGQLVFHAQARHLADEV